MGDAANAQVGSVVVEVQNLVWRSPSPSVGLTVAVILGLARLAGILFAKTEVAMIILPLMLFHLLQLVVMAVLSRRAAVF